MIDMKNLLLALGLVSAMTVASCSDDSSDSYDGGTDTATGPVECNLGEYSGDFEITEQPDLATLAGYTSISGDLGINCPMCTGLSELNCLTSVGERLSIDNNDALTSLDGLNALTSVGEDLLIERNDAIEPQSGRKCIGKRSDAPRATDPHTA